VNRYSLARKIAVLGAAALAVGMVGVGPATAKPHHHKHHRQHSKVHTTDLPSCYPDGCFGLKAKRLKAGLKKVKFHLVATGVPYKCDVVFQIGSLTFTDRANRDGEASKTIQIPSQQNTPGTFTAVLQDCPRRYSDFNGATSNAQTGSLSPAHIDAPKSVKQGRTFQVSTHYFTPVKVVTFLASFDGDPAIPLGPVTTDGDGVATVTVPASSENGVWAITANDTEGEMATTSVKVKGS
jgi:hypothetical protein